MKLTQRKVMVAVGVVAGLIVAKKFVRPVLQGVL